MKYDWLKIGTLNFNMDFNKEFFPMAGGGNPRTDPPDKGEDGDCFAGVCTNIVCNNGVNWCFKDDVRNTCYEVCCSPNTANGIITACKQGPLENKCITAGLKDI